MRGRHGSRRTMVIHKSRTHSAARKSRSSSVRRNATRTKEPKPPPRLRLVRVSQIPPGQTGNGREKPASMPRPATRRRFRRRWTTRARATGTCPARRDRPSGCARRASRGASRRAKASPRPVPRPGRRAPRTIPGSAASGRGHPFRSPAKSGAAPAPRRWRRIFRCRAAKSSRCGNAKEARRWRKKSGRAGGPAPAPCPPRAGAWIAASF